MKAYKVALCFLLLSTAIACRKDKKGGDDGDGDGGAPIDGSRQELSLDSIYLYAQQIYLWYDQLPTYAVFNPRQYTTGSTELANLQKDMYAITQIPINSLTGKPYEYFADAPTHSKYSYVTTKEGSSNGRLGSVDLEEKGQDYGFEFGVLGADDIRVLYVNPASPGFTAGLVRGDKVLAINGSNVNSASTLLSSAFGGATMTLKVQKADNSTKTYNLTKGAYTSNPVLKTAIFTTTGNTKTGYIALARFSRLSKAQTAIDAAFTQFANAGVKKLIVDLRYNGGGYVSTAEHLADLIAPTSLNDKVMYSEYYNEPMRTDKAPILKYQPLLNEDGTPRKLSNGQNATYADVTYRPEDNIYKFAKAGTLDGVTDVYFIVTRNTASASELVVNALKPHLNVTTVGSKTYGKPVGFFGINIDKYTVYMSNFLIRNSTGSADYFDGIEAQLPADDNPRYDFGDASENCIAKALAAINGGGRVAPQAPVQTRYTPQLSNVVDGMIESGDRKKLKE